MMLPLHRLLYESQTHCQSEKSSDQIIQFRHKEFVALKNDSFVDIIIDRLFVSWDKLTVEWSITSPISDLGQYVGKI